MQFSNHAHRDQIELIAGEYAEDIFQSFGGTVEPFLLSSRSRRHLWLALLEIYPSGAKSALVRFGFDAAPIRLIDWALETAPPLLWPVIRRCMPASVLSKGAYSQIASHLRARPRSGRVWLQMGTMTRRDWAAALALPDCLVEKSVLELMAGNEARALAVRDLWNLAIDQGRDPSNLRRAICTATSMDAVELIFTRSLSADQLPEAPVPSASQILPIRTKRSLMQHGQSMKNCMGRSFGAGFGVRSRNDAFFMWLGDPEGPAMIRLTYDIDWRLSEVKLTGNARPPDILYRRIVDAFSTVGVKDRPDVSDLLLAL
ncbi:hypothetical protein [Brevundimonas halotolerans]|nr:hypothetical protein [Brevundimonas halotolerans]